MFRSALGGSLIVLVLRRSKLRAAASAASRPRPAARRSTTIPTFARYRDAIEKDTEKLD